jgi:hypothetical protein
VAGRVRVDDLSGEDSLLRSLRPAPIVEKPDEGASLTLSDVRAWGTGSAGWALASSKQAWLETTDSVYASGTWMLSLTLVVTGLLALINLVTALTQSGWTAGASWDYACTPCYTCEKKIQACVASGSAPLDMCFLAWHARLVFPYLVAGQVRAVPCCITVQGYALPMLMLMLMVVDFSMCICSS